VTDDLTYDKIENRMRKAIVTMEEATKQHADDLKELAHRESKFKTVQASAFVNRRIEGSYKGVKITDKLAESLATVDTDEFRREYEMAKAHESASRQALSSIRAELEALRSLMASYRQQ
jgi:hypothetical protein